MATTKPDTKTALLDAAEALFAKNGIDGSSMRAITTKADTNLAAAHYHFGSKIDLVQAVFTRRLGPLNQKRLAVLDELEAAGPPSIEDVVHAFCAPALDFRGVVSKDGHTTLCLLLGRAFAEPGVEARNILLEQFRPVAVRFIAALGRLLPELSATVLFWRFHFMVGALSHILMQRDLILRSSAGRCDSADPGPTIEQLHAFLVAGLLSPDPATAKEPQ